MAVREIAAKFEAVCDCCKTVEPTLSHSRPKYWSDFHILRDAYDFQGCAVADGSVKLLLCLKCGEAATRAMNATFDEIRAASAAGARSAETGTGSGPQDRQSGDGKASATPNPSPASPQSQEGVSHDD